jgi:hypothetical protein
MRNAYSILLGKLKERNKLKDLGVDECNMKIDLKEIVSKDMYCIDLAL